MFHVDLKLKTFFNEDKIKNFMMFAKDILIIFIVLKILTTTVVVNGHVPSSSMEGTIMTGDRFLANRLAYDSEEPERFDVIVFQAPDEPETLLIKRIIGIPGDKVEFVEGQLILNGELVNEPYLNETMYGSFGPYHVPEGKYLTLGDNRNNSIDSRHWFNTFVDIDTILGKATFTYFPKIHTIN